MLIYQAMGSLPTVFPASLLPRIARECRRIRGYSGKRHKQIGLRFVSEKDMRSLNRAYRGKDCPTDVLSFSITETRGAFVLAASEADAAVDVGDIVVCTVVAKREAKRRAISAAEEIVRLIVHGTLHLGGYDHGTPHEEARMFRLQEEIVESVV